VRGAHPLDHYVGTTKKVNGNAVWTGKVALAPEKILTDPLRWAKPRRIFVNSMGDLFHESVPEEWIDKVFHIMALAPRHTFQVLTKRSKRMRDYLTNPATQKLYPGLPLPNVWLGVSAEDQTRADERIPDLLATPAAVRFVSAEPLLSHIDLSRFLVCAGCADEDRPNEARRSIDAGVIAHCGNPRLDWIIAGGESGPGARPMHPDWPRQIRDQCAAAGVPFFFKQHGEWAEVAPGPEHTLTIVESHGRNKPPKFGAFGSPCEEGDILMTADGDIARDWPELKSGKRHRQMRRLGKKRAGRLLDGREHNDSPEARS
jgi:protein gp37